MSTLGSSDSAAIASITQAVHSTAQSKGWWDEEREFGTLISLIHAEASEALEAYRDDPALLAMDKYVAHPAVTVELADVIIRVLDMAAHYDLDIGAALVAKANFNTTRPMRHGGKAC